MMRSSPINQPKISSPRTLLQGTNYLTSNSIMGISQSTAQILAPLSFAVDFSAQLYGMLSTSNMKQIHDWNMAAFSPYGNMIGYFFFPQQLLQLWWLRRLWTNPEPDQVKYVPYYALGNFCIAGWMLFWVHLKLKFSDARIMNLLEHHRFWLPLIP